MSSISVRKNEPNKPLYFVNDWDDWASGFDQVFNEMNRMLTPFRRLSSDESVFYPAVDIKEHENKYAMTFDLPGVNKDDINIDVKGNQISVSGKRKSEREERDESGRWYRQERFYGAFSRTITLPEDVKVDGIEAQYQEGVLQLEVPKTKTTASQKIKIKDSPGGRLQSKEEGREGKEESKTKERNVNKMDN